jgi:hypothetical protein
MAMGLGHAFHQGLVDGPAAGRQLPGGRRAGGGDLGGGAFWLARAGDAARAGQLLALATPDPLRLRPGAEQQPGPPARFFAEDLARWSGGRLKLKEFVDVFLGNGDAMQEALAQGSLR